MRRNAPRGRRTARRGPSSSSRSSSLALRGQLISCVWPSRWTIAVAGGSSLSSEITTAANGSESNDRNTSMCSRSFGTPIVESAASAAAMNGPGPQM